MSVHRPHTGHASAARWGACARLLALLPITASTALGQAVGGGPPPDPVSCLVDSGGAVRGGVTGRVVDRATGLPLAHARVVAAGPAGFADGDAERVGVTADARGRFHFCALTPGTTVTVVVARGDVRSSFVTWIPGDSLVRRDVSLPLGQPGSVTGRLVDRSTGEPVEAATIRVPAFGSSAVTSSQGRFRLPDLPAGRYSLAVSHVAYGQRIDSVTVRGGRALEVELRMRQRAVELDPLEVEVSAVRSLWLERNGFYHRMEHSHGYFLTEEEIQARNPIRLSDLFRAVAGVRVAVDGELEMLRAPRSMVTGQPCDLQYFVDGRSLPLPLGIDTFAPHDVIGIEVYRGAAQVPAEFNEGRAACGAVLIWTRVERS